MKTEQSVPAKISAVEMGLAILAVLSSVLLLIPNNLISRSKTIVATDFQAHLYSDSSLGGQSQVSWLDQTTQSWQCTLRDAHLTPFCSMQLDVLSAEGHGIDLSQYQTMTIWLNYQGDGEYLRVYLRNRNPQYFVMSDITSTKYNVVEVPVAQLANGLSVDMSNVDVADWWVSSRKIPLELSRPELNDVLFIEIQTGSQSREGNHQLQLDKIVWQGPLITQAALYKIIIVVWIICIFSVLVYRLVVLNMRLKNNQRYQQELISINDFLNLKNKKFEDLAKTDQLTGLLNRLGIRDALYQGVNNWKATRQPFSFVLIDIDHFKQINDTYGHGMGDKILQEMAQQLQKNIRHTDHLARWGGEEFLLVCPNTTLQEAERLAELLRERVEQLTFAGVGQITASFGVSCMADADLNKLFKHADDALYEAKKHGRNRVVSNI